MKFMYCISGWPPSGKTGRTGKKPGIFLATGKTVKTGKKPGIWSRGRCRNPKFSQKLAKFNIFSMKISKIFAASRRPDV